MVLLSVHRFDHALAYDVFSILLVVFVFNKNKKIKKFFFFGRICRIFFSLGLLDIACFLA
jgi:hypothetical protein